MGKLYAMGEMLIDFTPAGERCYRRNAGGAPANVAVGFARLGGRSAVVTKLGEDFFGDFLVETLRREGVDTSFVRRTAAAQTGLAFVSLDEKGDRSFAFWHDHAADRLLSAEEVEAIPFAAGDALHFGSVDLCGDALAAHERAIERAKAAGAVISFDPNLRYSLWDSRDALLSAVRRFLPLADVVKVSAEELYDLTRIRSEGEAARALFCGGMRLLFVTRGAGGAAAYTREGAHLFAPAERVRCVDATGAGDSFTAAMLFCLVGGGQGGASCAETAGRNGSVCSAGGDMAAPARQGVGPLFGAEGGARQTVDLASVLRIANRAASFAVGRSGAIPSLPTAAEVFGIAAGDPSVGA